MAYTLEDIARMAGVSRATVSRVLNNYPHVRPEVRERVLRVVREVGYTPHAVARSLATQRTHVLGLIIPEAVSTLFTDPFFSLLITGITHACHARGYHLMLSLFTTPEEETTLAPRLLKGGYVDGVILASTRLEDPLIGWMLEEHIPFVLISRHPDPRVTYVDADNIQGARMAVDYLIRQGHTRVATITGPLDMAPGQDRLEGYRRAMQAHRLPVHEAWIVEGDFTEEGGMAAMQQLLALPDAERPTAVFVASDTMAMGALKAVKDAGLHVPQDITLVGFDDLPQTAYLDPPLTTVRQPIPRLGETAVHLLLELLQYGPERVQRVVLPTELVIRAT